MIVGKWNNGRIGTVRAIRPYSGYGAVVFRSKQILQSPEKAEFSYKLLVERIVQFFQTGQPPVPNRRNARDVRVYGCGAAEPKIGRTAGQVEIGAGGSELRINMPETAREAK